MKIRTLLVSLLLFSLFPRVAHACEKGNFWSVAYLLRDDNRCEGIVEDSEPIYFPVILSESSDEYEFVIQSLNSTTFPVLEIRHQGEAVFSDPREIPQQGHIRLIWNHQNQPAGRYELYLENSEGVSRTFPFEHDPSWF